MPKSSLSDETVLSFFGGPVLAAFSTRFFDRAHRGDFLEALGVDPASLVLAKQVHGVNCVKARREGVGGFIGEADALWTDEPGIPLGVLTADCIPVFFWNAASQTIAIAHAGWRGLYGTIISRVVEEVFPGSRRPFQAAFGPAIRKCCYEVGPEFRDSFGPHYRSNLEPQNGGFVDLIGVARQQLRACGVQDDQIYDSQICTSCRNDQFYSSRKDKSGERILSVIMRRSAEAFHAGE